MKNFKNILLPFTICISHVFCEEVKLLIEEYIPFPQKIKNLNLLPTQFDWFTQDKFILVDQFMSEVIQLKSDGEISLSTKAEWGGNNNTEIVWAGVSNQGVKVVDKLTNSLTRTDFNLNPVEIIDFNFELYPEHAAEDRFGNVYLYSQSYSSIFILENSGTSLRMHVDLNKLRILSTSVKSMSTNGDGQLGVLGYEGNFFEFSKNGLKKFSHKSEIQNLEFLAPLKRDWMLFNKDGQGELIKTGQELKIPTNLLPIYDIKTKNNRIAILSDSQIIVLRIN